MAQYDYNYFTAEEKLKAQREVAKALQSKQLRNGQMVDGWFVGPGKGETLAALLQNALGAYSGHKAEKATAENEQKSMDQFKAGRDLFSTESDAETTARANANNPAAWTYQNPEDVGPSLDQLRGVQTFQAGRNPVEGKPLPPLSPTAQPQQQPPQAPTQYAPTMSSMDQAADPEAALILNSRNEGKVPPTAPVQPPASVLPQARAAVAPVPQVPSAQLPVQTTDIRIGPGTATPSVSPDAGFNIDTGLVEKIQTEQAGVLAKARAARQQQAQDLMFNSGDRGRGLVNAMQAAELQRIAKGEKPDEGFTLKEGESRFDSKGRKIAEIAPKPDKDAGKVAAQAESAVTSAEQFRAELRRMLESDIPQNAAGFAGTAGAMINKATGGLWKTDGAGARAELDGLKAKAKQAVIQQLQASGIPASQLANSNVEGESLIASYLNIDYDRMTPEQIREKLQGLDPLITKFINDQKAKYSGAPQAAPQGASAAPQAAPSTLNGIPAYTRGQTIRPQ